MGYFSNGTEGEMYEARYCARCLHSKLEDGCPVWGLHLFYNGEQNKSEMVGEMLSALIPRSKDGLTNERCEMFVQLIIGSKAI